MYEFQDLMRSPLSFIHHVSFGFVCTLAIFLTASILGNYLNFSSHLHAALFFQETQFDHLANFRITWYCGVDSTADLRTLDIW